MIDPILEGRPNPADPPPAQGAGSTTVNVTDVARLLHDLNNILLVVQSEGQLVLLSELPTPDQLASMAHRITENVQAAALMIDEFRKQGAATALDLASAVETSVDSLRSFAREHGVQLEVQVPRRSMDLSAVIYPGEAHRIVQNLVINAVQACNWGLGKVTVRLTQVSHSEHLNRPAVRLTVIDNGVGMDSNTIERVREYGYTTKENGSGLGLYTVDLLVSRRRGRVVVDSQLGKGTTITIDLPQSKMEHARSA